VEAIEGISRVLKAAVRRDRLVETALSLVDAPSPTGQAGEAADRLAGLLHREGFQVERQDAGHPAAPAVVARLESGRPGPTLQFEGHLDTVHLPFVAGRVEGNRLRGSGSSDMKSGLAAAVEAMRILRESGALAGGSILFTAHDLHEAPWGRGEQLDRLIRDGCRGDAVLIPEPLCDRLPLVGRGAATWKATLRRPGVPVHEVMRPPGTPSVIALAGGLLERLGKLGEKLGGRQDPLAGRETVFIGQIHGGEIYNQEPTECWLEGTRRWLPGVRREEVEEDLMSLFEEFGREKGVAVEVAYLTIRDAFRLDPESSLVKSFQRAHGAIAGKPLPEGAKPFVDDGNSFSAIAGVPAITHGPLAGGQHTLEEWVSTDDLVRVAHLYALTAALYCGGGER